ncbi:DUF192 domain-containing protein [aff. Roholtiella sp. LEGE 12411]|uniref:DUF192 domain-containing protein n=1 Tax=aff. Roholtiella sp. LEGE 12411 TaxID=1828822 RepID=UPI00187EF0DF|nr:DUF192 domain-containing protein [aff. Roholtiella sp. LEGE 12411]MBE9038421.1 DUF192 domain-containing protein [aff. Roholtiella sp. LEGE 12411]
MIRWPSLLSVLLGVLLISCSMPTTAKPPTFTSGSQTPVLESLGQTLQISGKAIVPNGTTIELEVARTPAQQAKGLMYRPALPNNRGMLFLFPSAQSVSFWMKNVPVSLDMVFLNKGVVKYIQASAPPCKSEPCPTYGPNTPIDTVIELRSGRAAELNLKVGDTIKIEFLNSGALQR